MTTSRVIWTEGMFLRPQHFQQMEHFLEMLLDARCRALSDNTWGFRKLVLDDIALKSGFISIREAQGIFRDGTPFSIPDGEPAPAALEISADMREATVLLALPARRAGVPAFALQPGPGSASARWLGHESLLHDTVLDMPPAPAPALLAQPNLSCRLDTDDCGAFSTLALARVVERQAGGALVLDPGHVAPVLRCSASPVLQRLLDEAAQLMRHRAATLAQRLGAPAVQRGAGELAEFLLLQATNRYAGVLEQFAAAPTPHPQALHALLCQSCSELATFCSDLGRQARRYGPYRHDDLRASFEPLLADLRLLLGEVVQPGALALPLQPRAPGLWSAHIPDAVPLHGASFVLAVSATLPVAVLRQRVPAQLKAGPLEHMRDLVMSQLPGVPLRELPAPPPRLPAASNALHFELDRSSALWPQLAAQRQLALHLAGELPDLALALWALRA